MGVSILRRLDGKLVDEAGVPWEPVGLLITPAGELVRQDDGEQLGEIIRVEIALNGTDTLAGHGTVSERSERYANSGLCSSSTENVKGKKTPYGVKEEPRSAESAAIARTWGYYCELFSSRRKLDEKRRRIIRNALRTMRTQHECKLEEAEELVRRAVLGLSRSPHHNGQNEQHRKYTEIRYALKGIGNESDDERIEKAIAWAAIFTDGQGGVDAAKVQRWLDEIRYTLSLAHRPERARAQDAWRRLHSAGFQVVQLDKAPWARLER